MKAIVIVELADSCKLVEVIDVIVSGTKQCVTMNGY